MTFLHNLFLKTLIKVNMGESQGIDFLYVVRVFRFLFPSKLSVGL